MIYLDIWYGKSFAFWTHGNVYVLALTKVLTQTLPKRTYTTTKKNRYQMGKFFYFWIFFAFSSFGIIEEVIFFFSLNF